MSPPLRGRLIALEGIDGCGKSTQARLLADSLGAELTHEPGATELGALLRDVVLEPSPPSPGPRAEALLLVADRAQHVDEVIEPALSAGRWVVSDRFSGSTLAYQGWGRGMDRTLLAQVVSFGAGGLEADLSVLVDVELTLARRRRRLATAPADRLERLTPEFHRRVRAGFLSQAADRPDRWVVVDGAAPVDDVARAISRAVAERLGHGTGRLL